MENMTLKYKLLNNSPYHIRAPQGKDAGYDLPAAYGFQIPPKEYVSVGTGVSVDIPSGFMGIIFGRSGNAFKKKVFVSHHGVIDSGYQGEIRVMLYNGNDHPIFVEPGDFIAQMVIVPCERFNVIY